LNNRGVTQVWGKKPDTPVPSNKSSNDGDMNVHVLTPPSLTLPDSVSVNSYLYKSLIIVLIYIYFYIIHPYILNICINTLHPAIALERLPSNPCPLTDTPLTHTSLNLTPLTYTPLTHIQTTFSPREETTPSYSPRETYSPIICICIYICIYIYIYTYIRVYTYGHMHIYILHID
jgi:hypothetical protein